MPTQDKTEHTPIADACKRSVIPNVIDHPDAYYAVPEDVCATLEKQRNALAESLTRILSLWDNDYIEPAGDGKARCNHAIDRARQALALANTK